MWGPPYPDGPVTLRAIVVGCGGGASPNLHENLSSNPPHSLPRASLVGRGHWVNSMQAPPVLSRSGCPPKKVVLTLAPSVTQETLAAGGQKSALSRWEFQKLPWPCLQAIDPPGLFSTKALVVSRFSPSLGGGWEPFPGPQLSSSLAFSRGGVTGEACMAASPARSCAVSTPACLLHAPQADATAQSPKPGLPTLVHSALWLTPSSAAPGDQVSLYLPSCCLLQGGALWQPGMF